jgi:hypothetical protein
VAIETAAAADAWLGQLLKYMKAVHRFTAAASSQARRRKATRMFAEAFVAEALHADDVTEFWEQDPEVLLQTARQVGALLGLSPAGQRLLQEALPTARW